MVEGLGISIPTINLISQTLNFDQYNNTSILWFGELERFGA